MNRSAADRWEIITIDGSSLRKHRTSFRLWYPEQPRARRASLSATGNTQGVAPSICSDGTSDARRQRRMRAYAAITGSVSDARRTATGIALFIAAVSDAPTNGDGQFHCVVGGMPHGRKRNAISSNTTSDAMDGRIEGSNQCGLHGRHRRIHRLPVKTESMCFGASSINWSPRDPSAEFGDPSLP